MQAPEPKRTWQISQVQQLVGLQRRDIQRACYRGEGGAGILDPQDSSWGRRRYDVDDLAKLFIVRQYKMCGHSLPEVAKLLDTERAQGRSHLALLETQAQRLTERLCDVLDQLVRAKALLAAAGEDGNVGRAAQLVGAVACCAGCTDVDALLASLEEAARCGLKGMDAADEAVSQAVHKAEATLGPDAGNRKQALWQAASRESRAGADAPDTTGGLRALLDFPGIDLALELWLGAGSFDFLCKAAAEGGTAGKA